MTGDRSVVKVGAQLPLSGFGAADGEDGRRGLDMAVEEINGNGGILGWPVEAVVVDGGEFDREDLLRDFRRLISEFGVDAICMGYNLNSGPELDIVADAGMIYYHNNCLEVEAEAVRANQKRYWGVFQHCPSDAWHAVSFLRVLERLELETNWAPSNHNMAIIKMKDSPYSDRIESDFVRVSSGSKWKLTLLEEVEVPTDDWKSITARLKQNPCSVIWITDYFVGDEVSFIQEFSKDPTPSLVHLQYGPSVPGFCELAGEWSNGVTWQTTHALIEDERGKRFRQQFRDRYRTEPGSCQASGLYDATHIYATAAGVAGTVDDRQRVAEATRRLVFRGVQGARVFDSEDQTARAYPDSTKDPSLGVPLQFGQIQNGENVVIDPAPYTTGEFELPPWFGQ